MNRLLILTSLAATALALVGREKCKEDACQLAVNPTGCELFQTKTVYQSYKTIYVTATVDQYLARRDKGKPTKSRGDEDDDDDKKHSSTRSSDDEYSYTSSTVVYTTSSASSSSSSSYAYPYASSTYYNTNEAFSTSSYKPTATLTPYLHPRTPKESDHHGGDDDDKSSSTSHRVSSTLSYHASSTLTPLSSYPTSSAVSSGSKTAQPLPTDLPCKGENQTKSACECIGVTSAVVTVPTETVYAIRTVRASVSWS